MRVAYATALLMMGSSTVLSFVLPKIVSPHINGMNVTWLAPHNSNLTGDEPGPNTSMQQSDLHAREELPQISGKRYNPADPGFLAALLLASSEGRWTFYYDGESFWTSHVTDAIRAHKYDYIFTMKQETKFEEQLNKEDRARYEETKEKKARLKAMKKMIKKKMKGDKQAYKAYKEQEKEAKRNKKAEVVAHDAVLRAARKKYEKNHKLAEEVMKKDTKTYFEHGGLAMFEDVLWKQEYADRG